MSRTIRLHSHTVSSNFSEIVHDDTNGSDWVVFQQIEYETCHTMSGLGIKSAGRPAHIRQKSSSRAARVNDSQSERNLETKRKPNKKATEIEKSDAATSAFVRRVLCASHLKPGADLSNSQSLEELLPPLTSSNEVDLQLYGLIAVIIKSFVQTWYSKITPDHEFTDEIIQIIAHCTRAFEQRLRRVDLEALLLDEIPDLLNQHAEGATAESAH